MGWPGIYWLARVWGRCAGGSLFELGMSSSLPLELELAAGLKPIHLVAN
jgi:hypothetical protein